MSAVQTFVQQVTHSPFTAAALFFGGAVVAATLYTYVYDYKEWPDRD